MPAFLLQLLPMLLQMAGGLGTKKLAGMAAPKIAASGLPGAGMMGKALGSGIGGMAAELGGLLGTGLLTDSLMGGEGEVQPKDNNENLSVLLSRMNGGNGMGDSAFDSAVKQRQVQGTLMQALANAGIDPAALKGVL